MTKEITEFGIGIKYNNKYLSICFVSARPFVFLKPSPETSSAEPNMNPKILIAFEADKVTHISVKIWDCLECFRHWKDNTFQNGIRRLNSTVIFMCSVSGHKYLLQVPIFYKTFFSNPIHLIT